MELVPIRMRGVATVSTAYRLRWANRRVLFTGRFPLGFVDNPATDPLLDGRASAFRNVRCVHVPRAGHWVHHDQLAEFLRIVRAFLKETD